MTKIIVAMKNDHNVKKLLGMKQHASKALLRKKN